MYIFTILPTTESFRTGLVSSLQMVHGYCVFKVKLMMNLPKNFEKFAQESLCIKENDKSHSFPPLYPYI